MVWMYYETDGDAGAYRITLFTSEAEAEKFKAAVGSAYGVVGRATLFGLSADAEEKRRALRV
jgi:hypothetical protein